MIIDPAWEGTVQFYELFFGTWLAYAFLTQMWERALRARLPEWKYVLIDDRVPVVGMKMCYAHHENPNLFWGPFIEKAYAKLHGGYSQIVGGKTEGAIRIVEDHLELAGIRLESK